MKSFSETPETRKGTSIDQTCALAWKEADSHRIFWKQRGFWHYLKTAWRSAALYTHWRRFLKAFRRFRLIALILRVTTLLLTALETGALVLVSTFLLLLFLPILIFLLLGIFLTALVEAPQKNREIQAEIGQKRVYVLFFNDESGSFFKANAYDLASRQNAAVVIISPFWLSSRGIAKNGRFYVSARKEGENIFLVRRYYFFLLRKKVLANQECIILY